MKKGRVGSAVAIVALFCVAVPLQADRPWWDKTWKYRRPVAVKNVGKIPLPAGMPVRLLIDDEDPALRGNMREDAGDLRMRHGDAEIKVHIEPHPTIKGRCWLWFPLKEPVPPGQTDGRYDLYYGNPAASKDPNNGREMFVLFDDFEKPDESGKRWTIGPASKSTIAGGAMVLRGDEQGEPHPDDDNLLLNKPIALADIDPGQHFCMEWDLTYAKTGGEAYALCATLFAFEDASAARLSDGERTAAEDLIAKLGDESWDVRSEAHRLLIGMGTRVIPLLEAARSSGDADVRFRAERIVTTIREQFPIPSAQIGVIVNEDGCAFVDASAQGKKWFANYRTASNGTLRFKLQRAPSNVIKLLVDGKIVYAGRMEGDFKRLSILYGRRTPATVREMSIDNVRIHVISDNDPEILPGKEEGGG